MKASIRHHLCVAGLLLSLLWLMPPSAHAAQYLSFAEARRALVYFIKRDLGYTAFSLKTYCGRTGWRARVALRNRVTCDVFFRDGAGDPWCGNALIYETDTQYLYRRAYQRGFCGE
jgi:hypothetical protein